MIEPEAFHVIANDILLMALTIDLDIQAVREGGFAYEYTEIYAEIIAGGQ